MLKECCSHFLQAQPLNILTLKGSPSVLMTLVVYIDDTCVVSFGTREEHEILLLRVLKRMDGHNLKMYPAKCGLTGFLLRIPKSR